MNLASLGAIAGGINQGLEYSQRDKERKENQEFLKSQRQFVGEQQARQKDEWAKTDQYGKDLAGVYAPVEQYTMPEAKSENYESGPQQPVSTTTRPPSMLESQQRLLAAQSKAGKYDDALKTRASIEKIFSEADRQNYNAFLQSAGNISDLADLGKRAAKLVSADSSPILVDEPRLNDDGKTWTANVRSRLNGSTMPLTFSSKEDLLKGLQYHMDYETYAANRKAELEAAQKIAEKRAEGVKLKPGETFSQYDKDGRLIQTAGNDNATSADAALLRLGAAGAGTGGKRGGGSATSPIDLYNDVIDRTWKGQGGDAIPAQDKAMLAALVHRFASNAGYDTTKMPPSVAVEAAHNYYAAGGSKAETLGVDPVTAQPRREWRDPKYGAFDLGPVVGSLTADQAKNLAEKMLAQQGGGQRLVKGQDGSVTQVSPSESDIAATQKKLRAAAFDTSGPGGTSVLRRELEDDIKSQVQLSAEQAMAKYPDKVDAIRSQVPSRVAGELEILNRKLNLIRQGMKPEAVDDKPKSRLEDLQGKLEVLKKSGSGLSPAVRKAAIAETEGAIQSEQARQVADAAKIKAGRELTEKNRTLKAEAQTISPETISKITDPRELESMKVTYGNFMDGRQREAIDMQLLALRRQAEIRRAQAARPASGR